ncbi:MAG: hypothetical protein R6U13_15730 [Desulfatiglandaceae bacterium]
MPNTKIPTLLKIYDPNLQRQVIGVLNSVDGFSVQDMDMTADMRADMLILELGENPEQDYQGVQKLVDKGLVRDVFVLSASSDPQVLLGAIKVGVKEFLPLPLNPDELARGLEKIKAGRESLVTRGKERREGKIFTVIGCKGGAGATSIAVNMAVALAEAKEDRAVLLMEMKMSLGELPVFLNFTPQYHWIDLARNIKRVDEIYLRGVLHHYSNRLSVLPGPENSNGNTAEFQNISDKMLKFLQGMFDVIVIDAGHFGYGFIEQNVRKSDKVLLISELNLLSLANTNKILGILRRTLTNPDDTIEVIINRYAKKSDVTPEEAEKILKTRIFWRVPNDYKFAVSAINHGKPYEQIGRRHRLTRNMRELAEAVMPESENGSRKWKWFFK